MLSCSDIEKYHIPWNCIELHHIASACIHITGRYPNVCYLVALAAIAIQPHEVGKNNFLTSLKAILCHGFVFFEVFVLFQPS